VRVHEADEARHEPARGERRQHAHGEALVAAESVSTLKPMEAIQPSPIPVNI
jgi:hypothetical protein